MTHKELAEKEAAVREIFEVTYVDGSVEFCTTLGGGGTGVSPF